MRHRLFNLLRGEGMIVARPFAHLPSRGVARYIVPLSAGPWRYTLGRVIATQPLGRGALLMARMLPMGEPLLARMLPTVGIAAQRPDARPLGAWIGRLAGETREPESILVGTSWRGDEGAVVLHCFDSGASSPWGIAKVAPSSSGEWDALSALGPAASAAGVRVPRPLAGGRIGARSALVETPIDGEPAAQVLIRSPTRFRSLAAALVAWLERWNRATAARLSSSMERLDTEVLGPAAALAPLMREGEAYRSWLATRCAAVAGADIPLVAAHNDLTMWNVVLDDENAIGVLDWGEAAEGELPLGDLFYGLADAAAACDRYDSRLSAVQDCFAPGGRRTPDVDGLKESVVGALALPDSAVELCFHACWLRHARNEQRGGGGDGSFLEIVQWLARQAGGTAG